MNGGWKPEQLERPSLAPRNWPGWIGVALLWCLGHLPRRLGLLLVRPLGPLMRLALGSRRRIAERNLEVCLPDLPSDQRDRVLRESFDALARMLVETAWCWAGRPPTLAPLVDDSGYEHIETVREAGRGLLLVTAHVTCLEMGARAIGERFAGQGVYRPLGNPVLEWYQNRGRSRYARGMLSKRDLRGAVRLLRRGGMLWYAPDQDFGPQESVFAPFFGVQTATLLATHRLPALTGCRVVVMMPRYDRERDRYVVEVTPPLEAFPGDDPVADLARINALLEAQVRKAPDQYWWVHRRFKTRPEGEPDFYGRDSRGS
ncbi:MAG: LpxL/LpxP family Kdo(2)-lipid IV(A) lauroyl/palmitoleoyl acyltransferase [Xanthomonadales bacterium]|jgi:KDO2-lipid IV(A) lauroyltransferase|nr:LpxL/LpxP family Kdo(2)-lipid IV(A) lauroyl/palmitoleoyl acyltransferase [Xanthomonadales bacterium]